MKRNAELSSASSSASSPQRKIPVSLFTQWEPEELKGYIVGSRALRATVVRSIKRKIMTELAGYCKCLRFR